MEVMGRFHFLLVNPLALGTYATGIWYIRVEIKKDDLRVGRTGKILILFFSFCSESLRRCTLALLLHLFWQLSDLITAGIAYSKILSS